MNEDVREQTPQELEPLQEDDRRPTHRKILERWVIEGTLVLETPAHFGNGEEGDYADMPLLLDESEETITPLLPGTSIAGALRNYLREVECGDGKPFPARRQKKPGESDKDIEDDLKRQQGKERDRFATLLFGGFRGDDEGDQSPLIVHDACGITVGTELREGVKINGATRTSAEDMLFDIELLSAGTEFPLRFELTMGLPRKRKSDNSAWNENLAYTDQHRRLLGALAVALDGLGEGEITLGARKRRGYGKCAVREWKVTRYKIYTTDGLLAWLINERESWKYDTIASPDFAAATTVAEALTKLQQSKKEITDQRKRAKLKATFAIDGSLLIRSGFGEEDAGPDAVHLHSLRNKTRVPILPGTSWTGVLRHRALQIARTVAGENNKSTAETFVSGLFGPEEIEKGERHTKSSRLTVEESHVENSHSLVQTRVKIDRFTGGAFESALFSEQPIFASDKTTVTLNLELKSPSPMKHDDPQPEIDSAEVGLVLLLVKDLWTGDLAVGGESGVGRGRLRGQRAELTVGGQTWIISASGEDKLHVDRNPESLQVFVDKFNERIRNHG